LIGKSVPIRVTATLVSANLFSILGAPAGLGRTFRSSEDLATQNNFVLLSHRIWQQRFASDLSVIGQWINLDGIQRQVVGVMPPDFRFPSPQTDLWVPWKSIRATQTVTGRRLHAGNWPHAPRRNTRASQL